MQDKTYDEITATTKGENSTEDKHEIEITQQVIQKMMESNTKLVPDKILHAIILVCGIKLDEDDVKPEKMSLLILRQKNWFQHKDNVKKYYETNYYKILMKVMDRTEYYKQKMNTFQIADIKTLVLSEFLKKEDKHFQDPDKTVQMTKMNGIFCYRNTFTGRGRRTVYNVLQSKMFFHSFNEYTTSIMEQYVKKELVNYGSEIDTNENEDINRVIREENVPIQHIMQPVFT